MQLAIKFKHFIEWNSNNPLDLDLGLNSFELKFSFDSIQFNSNSIEDKRVTNCCKTY